MNRINAKSISVDAQESKYVKGCGKPMRVKGTNGGAMMCGSTLTGLDKRVTIEICNECVEKE